MRSLLGKVFLIGAIIFCSVMRTGFALPEIMPLEQVKSGMSGTGYTIVDNSGIIKPFHVEIVGLMDNGKGSNKMILAKASGDLIEKTGGVLQGMSGSPVYVDGKLIGALSAGFKEMSPYTFFITPIETMLKIWDLPDDKEKVIYTTSSPENKNARTNTEPENETEEINSEPPETTETSSPTDEPEKVETTSDETENAETSSEDTENTETDSPDKDAVVDKKSGLLFKGFDSAGLKFLKSELGSFGTKKFYTLTTGTSNSELKYNATLEPGSMIGVAVLCGDFLLGATGTVTAVDGNRILGFGHSFTHAGNVNFFMTEASVVGTVSGVDGNGIKVSGVEKIIGRINQDREAGVSGIIGKFPSVIPINISVTDKTLNASETYHAKMAYNETLIPKVGAAVAYTALSKVADSLAESTVNVDFSIRTNVAPDGILTRKNMFYNATDVGQVAVVELMQALTLVCSNTTEESNIYEINVDMTMEAERKTASLISATPDKYKVKPGETVNFNVKLRPYRKPEETVQVPYTVPPTMKEGRLTLDIHGGALVPVIQAVAPTGLITPSSGTPEKTYSDKINSFIKTGRNNQLVVEPGTNPLEVKTERELKKDIERAKKAQERFAKSGQKLPDPNKNKVDTDYIIDNVIQTAIEVDKI